MALADTSVEGGAPGDLDPTVEQDGEAGQGGSVDLLGHHLQAETDGRVVLNKDGTPRKKPGRKPGQKTGEKMGQETGPIVAPKTPAQKAAQKVTTAQTAKMISNAMQNLLAETIGPEWLYQSQEEADGIRDTLHAYMDAKGATELSPEVLLGLALTGYGMPRLREQNTREKISGFFGKIVGFFRRK